MDSSSSITLDRFVSITSIVPATRQDDMAGRFSRSCLPPKKWPKAMTKGEIQFGRSSLNPLALIDETY